MDMEMERENARYLAVMANLAEHFPDMVEPIKKVCEINADLSFGERNILSVAYKSSVSPCRFGWRVILASEQRELEQKGDTELLKQIKGFRQKIEVEIEDICRDAIDLIDNYLLPQSHSAEARVFYFKMKGDYYRYLAEIKVGDERTNIADKAQQAYEDAEVAVANDLAVTHPIRLGLALNFSVFYSEIIHNTDMACKVAKLAIDEAESHLDSLPKETKNDSVAIMQMLMDNLTLWRPELRSKAGEDEYLKLEDSPISAPEELTISRRVN